MLIYNKNDKKRRLTLGLDLDGTSGDFHTSFRNVLIEHQGFDLDRIPVETPAIYSYIDAGCFPDLDTFKIALHAATHQGVYYQMTPYEGLRENIIALTEEGVGIRVITSRPDDALNDTIGWLEDVAQIPYDTIFITDEKTKVEADIYLDDMPKHINNFRNVGKRAVIYNQPYNTDLDGERVSAWSEVPDTLLARITA